MKKAKIIPAKIAPAGMRADKMCKNTGVPQPDRSSLIEEIEWRKEHRQ